MKYKTIFRLALKFLGVWLVATGAARIVVVIAPFIIYLSKGLPYGGNFSQPELWLLAPIQSLVPVGVGLYLFFGGRWIVDRAIPGNRPYCHECGYDLRHSESNACPECGTEFKPAN